MMLVPPVRWACLNSMPRLLAARNARRWWWWPPRQVYSTLTSATARTRNIGIIAHIDAGKTTTTERMLYYSGFTRSLGDVDDGSTVTDFLPAERARGITIQSAAITFHWPPLPSHQPQLEEVAPSAKELRAQGLPQSAVSHAINLIDTPGHADFSFEVVRALRILDGAVCILDGVAGVEAQTEKVWHQASRYRIPRIVFVNKLDRDGAAFGRTVREVAAKLLSWPAVCQIPWIENGDGRFQGLGDVINLTGLVWDAGGDGKKATRVPLETLDEQHPEFAAELRRARVALVELLSEHDDVMVETFLATEDHLAVEPLDILDSLRRCLGRPATRLVPVYAGASFRNIGVQPLLDAIVDLLPGPDERPDPPVRIGSARGGLSALLAGQLPFEEPPAGRQQQPQKKSKRSASDKALAGTSEAQRALQRLEACALAFKVVNDARRGMLVYVRVYAGALVRNAALFNTNLHVSERGSRLLRMYAADAVDVPTVVAGDIGVIAGLRHARTGDTLLAFGGGGGKGAVPPEPVDSLQLAPIAVPPAVFFTSVEPHSLAEEKCMHDALALLLREDPSLHVTVNEESGQTLLSGMGELHLEIARDRLVNDLRAKASIGPIEIGYRECIGRPSAPTPFTVDRDFSGRRGRASCVAVIEPLAPAGEEFSGGSDDQDVVSSQLLAGNCVTIRVPGLSSSGAAADEDEEEVQTAIADALARVLPAHVEPQVFTNALTGGALAGLARGPKMLFPMHAAHVIVTLDLFSADSAVATDMGLLSGPALSAAARGAAVAALRSVAAADDGGAGLMEPVMDVVISVPGERLGAVIHDVASSRGGHVIGLDDGDGGDTEATTAAAGRAGPDADAAKAEAQAEADAETEASLAINPSRIYAPPDPYGAAQSTLSSPDRPRTIRAKVPLREMVGYLRHLRALTAGRGTFVMNVAAFERMGGARERRLVAELRGGFF